MIIHKLDENGRSVWQYTGELLERHPHYVCLEAFFNRDDMALGYTTFKKGDRFVEYFYNDRWYNVFAVYDRDDGVLKGWYCNICRPAQIEDSAVFCQDLALDVWVNPDGTAVILDEDEFERLEITAQERENGRNALQTLLQLAEQHTLPR